MVKAPATYTHGTSRTADIHTHARAMVCKSDSFLFYKAISILCSLLTSLWLADPPLIFGVVVVVTSIPSVFPVRNFPCFSSHLHKKEKNSTAMCQWLFIFLPKDKSSSALTPQFPTLCLPPTPQVFFWPLRDSSRYLIKSQDVIFADTQFTRTHARRHTRRDEHTPVSGKASTWLHPKRIAHNPRFNHRQQPGLC